VPRQEGSPSRIGGPAGGTIHVPPLGGSPALCGRKGAGPLVVAALIGRPGASPGSSRWADLPQGRTRTQVSPTSWRRSQSGTRVAREGEQARRGRAQTRRRPPSRGYRECQTGPRGRRRTRRTRRSRGWGGGSRRPCAPGFEGRRRWRADARCATKRRRGRGSLDAAGSQEQRGEDARAEGEDEQDAEGDVAAGGPGSSWLGWTCLVGAAGMGRSLLGEAAGVGAVDGGGAPRTCSVGLVAGPSEVAGRADVRETRGLGVGGLAVGVDHGVVDVDDLVAGSIGSPQSAAQRPL